MTNEGPGLSPPGKDVVGAASPVVHSLEWLDRFFSADPVPDLGTEESASCGALAANHLLQLIGACGLLNISGKHSAAVVLLRSLEDALDCFAGVTLVTSAAEDWARGALRPSDAAKRWTSSAGDSVSCPGAFSLGEYRKAARGTFNKYSHCSYDLCLWGLYMKPAPHPETGEMGVIPEINRTGLVIDRNGHAIDAHLTAHLLEFIQLVQQAYGKALDAEPTDAARLAHFKSRIVDIMELHNKHGCQDVRTPPEIRRPEPE